MNAAGHEAPPSIFERLTSPISEFGGVLGLLYLVNRFLNRLSPRLGIYLHDFMVQPVSDKPLLTPSMAKNFTFREIRAGDPEIGQMPVPAHVVSSRYRQGAVCLGAFSKGALAGYIWLCFGPFEEDEVRTRYGIPEDGTASFDFDLFVVPERRLGTAFAAIWHGANLFLSERGVRNTFSRVSKFNIASIRAHGRLGSRRIGSAFFLKLGRLELVIGTVAPWLWLSVGARGAPRLRLIPASRRDDPR